VGWNSNVMTDRVEGEVSTKFPCHMVGSPKVTADCGNKNSGQILFINIRKGNITTHARPGDCV
jgi:hypothetical protein